MLDLAQHYGQGPVHLMDVAQRQEISVKYLEQLIIPLKKQGLIESIRGPKGGYILKRAPEKITFAEIVQLLENTSRMIDCVDNPDVCERSPSCPTRNVWVKATHTMYEELDSVTLADQLPFQKTKHKGAQR